MAKKQEKTGAKPAAVKKKTRRKRYEINRRLPMVIHTQELSDNLDQEWKITGKDYTVIINQRLNESYERDPVKLK